MGFFSSILGLGRGKKTEKQALTGFNYLKDNPLIGESQGAGSSALGSLASFLGLGEGGGGFGSFLDSTGYNFTQDEAMRGVINSASGANLLRSGAAAKALQDRAAQVATQNAVGPYLQLLQQLIGGGQTAALGVGAAGTTGGGNAAATQPENKGILGRFFGI